MTGAPVGRTVLFYSAWPLGYHNQEAERKALALVRHDRGVVYVAGVGVRNPNFRNVAKLADRVGRKLRPGGATPPAEAPDAPAHGLRAGAIIVVPPRQVAAVRRANARWVGRQLAGMLPAMRDVTAWIRWPTPELVDALRADRPGVVIYECVDAYHVQPGMTPPWAGIHEAAERDLVSLADVVVAPGEGLADRFRDWGADVRVIPHGVDLGPPPGPSDEAEGGPVTIGFVGTLDYKIEIPVLRAIAQAHPEWRLRLVGPVQEGFPAEALVDLPNVSLEPPVPATEVATLNASFSAGIMPYFDHPAYWLSCPLKSLEYLAAGRAAVGRYCPALERYRGIHRFAETPEDYVRELELLLAAETPELARERRAIAEAGTWPRRLDEVAALVDELEARAA